MNSAVNTHDLIVSTVKNDGLFAGHVPLSLITVRPGHNPRKHRNQDDYNDTKQSMQDRGLLQPILLRVSDDENKLEVVAGETRFSIASDLQWPTILAVVKKCTVEEATLWAGEENMKRSNMSFIEEADHAKALMEQYAGDRQEVCRITRWSNTTLSSRLLLTHAIESVRKALVDRAIMLGHAEVLSTLSAGQQEKFLPKIIEEQLSVKDAKDRVLNVERKLIESCFNKAECVGCVHNTDVSVDLFSSTVDMAGKCRNPSCYNQKTREHLLSVKDELEETFSTVKYSSEIAASDFIKVVEVGDNAVGQEQKVACKSCTNFGAVITDHKGMEGQIKHSICFDLACHKEKREAFQEAQNTIDEKAETVCSDTSQTTKPKAKTSKTEAQTKAFPDAVSAIAMKQYTQCAADLVAKHPAYLEVICIAKMVLSLSGKMPDQVKELTGITHLSSSGSDMAKFHKRLLSLDDTAIESIKVSVVAAYLTQDAENSLRAKAPHNQMALAIVSDLDGDISDSWQIDEAFLKAINKSAIEEILTDTNFESTLGEDEGSLKKLIGSKKDKLIERILKTPKVLKGYLPFGMRLADYKS